MTNRRFSVLKHSSMISTLWIAHVFFGLLLAAPAFAQSTESSSPGVVYPQRRGVDLFFGKSLIQLRFVRDNALRVHLDPNGGNTSASLIVVPHRSPATPVPVQVKRKNELVTMTTTAMRAELNTKTFVLLVDAVGSDQMLLQQNMAALVQDRLKIQFAEDATLYGIRGTSVIRAKHPQGIIYGLQGCAATAADEVLSLHSGPVRARACPQGNASAPFVWSTRGFGVLVNSNGATFDLKKNNFTVTDTSSPDLDYYLMVGKPAAIFSALADISGHAPMFPKWAMGFTNSQWGINQKELLQIVQTYREKHIPIDNFTIDYDWKAWGMGDYGEFRWNPKNFPDGPSGRLAREMAAEGMHITGIMKPRIHMDSIEGRYATAHNFWMPREDIPSEIDPTAHEINFDKRAVRDWFGALSIQYAFDKGIAGWWNDEADNTTSNTQFLNMQRSLYDAQRAHSNQRVWSINRSFWLGAQRYAYGMWSGDIETGFASMATQRGRMLHAIDVGEMLWGMDGGGFSGHPSDQNYARWIEFGAFTPIFRVHGEHYQRRQPWVYGPIAEKAATRAIRLRYALIPYIYSYDRQYYTSGVGLVTPLIFDWPTDPHVRNDVDAWMFGQWLLVSPVVEENQIEKHVYLPAGTWTEYFTGKVYRGGQTVTLPTDSKTWEDIPLFIRQGAILPTQKVLDYVHQQPIHTVSLDIFPADHRTSFNYYDDDGNTYDYEHGDYFLQPLSVEASGHAILFDTGAVRGSFHPALKDYLVKLHGSTASTVSVDGHSLPAVASLDALQAQSSAGWCAGHDLYGPVTYIKLPSGKQQHVQIQTGSGT